jgi:glycine betaine/proline transport system substrate-binding protein
MTKLLAAWLVSTAAVVLSSAPASAECGEVTIAEMNWASAGIAANLDKLILEAGYGCKVEIVPGDTVPTFTSMNEKATPDIAPELWVNSMRTAYDQAISENRLVRAASVLSDGGVEGWWIPKFIADAHPEIRSVNDALARPELFPAPEDPNRAAVYNCPVGWSCQISTANLFKALDAANRGFDLIDTGSAAGLDGTIANAVEKEQGWLGYYWAPTALLGRYEMVRLSFGVPHDKAEWDRCTSLVDCTDPKVNSYPVSDVLTVTTKAFADGNLPVMAYLRARQWDNHTLNKVLAWMNENQASNAEAARYFLDTYGEMWKAWMPPEVSAKVEAALKS